MRYESLIIGIVVLAFGVYLVSSHGYVGGTYLPGLIGLPAPPSPSNSTVPSFLPVYSVGTLVALFGLGLIGNGIRSASRGSFGAPAGQLPPEALAALSQAMSRAGPTGGSIPPGAAGAAPGALYCSRCGRPNLADARFCNGCGSAMPAVPAAPVIAPTVPPSGPPSGGGDGPVG